MIRLRLANGFATALILCASLSYSYGADKKSQSTGSDLDAIRQAIADQSKQIEALTEQIAHLTQVLESHGIPVAAATPAVPHPSVTPENTASMAAEPAQPTADTPGTHVVTKGETLTSIAKHYKITVGDLEKVNKIGNDRMLQIGQTLTIPSVTPFPTPEEKKENQ